MIIAGGSYLECCAYPAWDRLFGSGLRATMALQALSPSLTFRTYAPPAYRADVQATLMGAGIQGEVTESHDEMVFRWLHPFELMSWPNPPLTALPYLNAEGEAVLRFGMIEGSAQVTATRAVYDPQNETGGFFENGSETRELVMILSERELVRQTHTDLLPNPESVQASIKALFELKAGKVDFFAILLKDGLGGLKVFLGEEPKHIPTYAAESFFKIGSGDVLAAAFAYFWAERRLDIMSAANHAARALAWFVEGARLPLPQETQLPNRECLSLPRQIRILERKTLEIGQLLLKTEDWINSLGVEPVFDIFGEGSTAKDLPTLVLVGESNDWAAGSELIEATQDASKVVVFWPDAPPGIADHFARNVRVTGDYASALFHLLREPVG